MSSQITRIIFDKFLNENQMVGMFTQNNFNRKEKRFYLRDILLAMDRANAH